MATHSSTLAWKIPWTEEPGRLQCMGSQRVRHDGAIELNWNELNQQKMMTSLMAQTVKHLTTMQETQFQSLGGEDPLEKKMATLSSILAWKIPWAEEPGRLQSMGSQRVGHNWATSLSLSINRKWCYRKKYFKQKLFYFNWIQSPRSLMYLW